MKLIEKVFKEHNIVLNQTLLTLEDKIEESCNVVKNCLINGNKLILFGNGGSASDAQHIAAEFVGRYKKERISLPAISLNTDTSALTAIGNDYGYENVFLRQASSLVNKGDVVMAFSTSGNSPNVVKCLEYLKSMDNTVILFTGNSNGKACNLSDIILNVPSTVTARIQEMHILIGHIICQSVDELY